MTRDPLWYKKLPEIDRRAYSTGPYVPVDYGMLICGDHHHLGAIFAPYLEDEISEFMVRTEEEYLAWLKLMTRRQIHVSNALSGVLVKHRRQHLLPKWEEEDLKKASWHKRSKQE